MSKANWSLYARYRAGDRSPAAVEANRTYMRDYMRQWRRRRGADVRAHAPGETADALELRLGAIACRRSMARLAERAVALFYCRCCGIDLLFAEQVADGCADYDGAVGTDTTCAICVAEHVA